MKNKKNKNGKTVRSVISTPMFYRMATIQRKAVDEDNRTAELSFSSEEPYQRYYGFEILGHKKGEIDLEFIAGGTAPLLKDHWRDEQTGVIEKVWIDDSKGRAQVRFGRGVKASEEFQDVVDGIRTNVSVGYRVNKIKLIDSKDGVDTYRVTDWTPLEVSIVSIPADVSVGVGREAEPTEQKFETVVYGRRAISTLALEPPGHDDHNATGPHRRDDHQSQPINEKGVTTMDDATLKFLISRGLKADATEAEAWAFLRTLDKPNEGTPVDVKALEGKTLDRVNEILALGAGHGFQTEAQAAIKDGKTVEQFSAFVLGELKKRGLKPVTGPENLGLTTDEAKSFSFLRLLGSLSDPTSASKREQAAFEFEVVDSFRKVSTKKEVRGVIVPPDVLRQGIAQRDLNVTTDSAGGYSVATNLVSFIDALRNKILCGVAGATVLNDLVGDLAIPRLSSGATAYWVAESGEPTESQQTLGQLALAPKTIASYTDISRKLLIQSSLDIEAMVRDDLAANIALALDLAALHGTGASNQPTGIAATAGIGSVAGGTNGLAPDWSHVVELETDVAVANADVGRLGYMTNAKVRGKLKQVFANATYGEIPLWSGKNGQGDLNGYRAHCTNQVSSTLTKGTSSGVCSAIFFGNWADLIIALWSGIDILVDPYTGSASGTVRVTAFQDADIGIRNAGSFAAMLDALTV